jgi:hypothetical protein
MQQDFGWKTRRLRWEDIIRMDLREVGGEAVVWIHLAQVRDQWQRTLVNTVMNLWGSINGGEFLD